MLNGILKARCLLGTTGALDEPGGAASATEPRARARPSPKLASRGLPRLDLTSRLPRSRENSNPTDDLSIPARSFQPERQPGHAKLGHVGGLGQPLIRPPLKVGESTGQ